MGGALSLWPEPPKSTQNKLEAQGRSDQSGLWEKEEDLLGVGRAWELDVTAWAAPAGGQRRLWRAGHTGHFVPAGPTPRACVSEETRRLARALGAPLRPWGPWRREGPAPSPLGRWPWAGRQLPDCDPQWKWCPTGAC